MAPKNGYRKNTDPRGEYVRLDQVQDAEAKLCAAAMGQTLEVWIADAVAHHLYRVELMQCDERYRADAEAFNKGNTAGAPIREDVKYQPTRPKPTITRTPQGSSHSGTGRGRSFRR